MRPLEVFSYPKLRYIYLYNCELCGRMKSSHKSQKSSISIKIDQNNIINLKYISSIFNLKTTNQNNTIFSYIPHFVFTPSKTKSKSESKASPERI